MFERTIDRSVCGVHMLSCHGRRNDCSVHLLRVWYLYPCGIMIPTERLQFKFGPRVSHDISNKHKLVTPCIPLTGHHNNLEQPMQLMGRFDALSESGPQPLNIGHSNSTHQTVPLLGKHKMTDGWKCRARAALDIILFYRFNVCTVVYGGKQGSDCW